jgi:serine/threonine protein kinase
MKRIEHIEMIEQIGSGGAGSVWKGVDLHTGKLVAVKVLWKNLFKDEKIRKKFLEEANQYLYLEHPNIVKLKDFIAKDSGYYLVMEYIDGQTLEEYINKVTGPIPEEVAAAILIEVLAAIGYAHQQNIIHLDLKPANIMISAEGVIKVLDFGISSKSEEAGLGNVMGSPMYMSPEQIDGKGVDHRSDIYALGVTLHQMLCGQLPYPTNMSKFQLFQHIKEKPLPRLSSFVSWASDIAQFLVDTATAKNPNHRFPSCEAFKEALIRLS